MALFKVVTTPAPAVPKVLDTEFKQFYAGVNRSMDWASLSPHIQIAADREIIPAIGQDFYDALDTAYNGAGVAAGAMAETFRRLRMALAHYAMYYGYPQLAVRVGDAGTMETNHEGATPVRQWAFNTARWEVAKTAAAYLDSALQHMEAQVEAANTSYDVWKNSPAYTQNRDLLIPNARVMGEYYALSTSYRSYQLLRPLLRKAELMYLRPALCNTLYDTVANQAAQNTLSAANEALLPYLRRYVAEVAMSLAGSSVNLIPDGAGWRISENAYAEAMPQEALRSAIQALTTQAEQNAARYLQDLRDHLYSNIDDYPQYRDSACNELKVDDPDGFYYPGEDYDSRNPPPPGAFIL